MSSPFSLFRRNQRILMIVATGLSIISFVFLGAISDPREMPPLLIAILFAAMLGGVFWLAGLRQGKANDWGLTGTILGVVLALAMIWSGRESSAVTLDGGNLTGTEVSELIKQRQVANGFVQMAASAGVPTDGDEAKIREAQFTANQRMRSNMFGFMSAEEISTEDVILGEILRREADEMGIVISDKVVLDFIQKVSDKKMTKSAFANIRGQLQVSESSLMDMLREEIKAREAAKLLSSQTYMTPENQWDFYQKLNVKQSAEIVSVPVSSFVTDAMQPSDAELQTLLDQYRQNLPGYTPEGRPEEGRPGFFQLPKFQLAYLEAVFDDIKETVGEVTDEEIQARYQEEYVNDVAPELPEEMKAPIESPAKPPTLPPLNEEPTTEEPTTEEPTTEEPKTEEPKTEESDQSLNETTFSKLQFVAFQEDAPAEEQPEAEEAPKEAPALEAPPKAEEQPATEEPKEQPETAKEAPAKPDDKPAPKEETPEEPAEPNESEPAKEETKTPALGEDGLPPAPTSDVPELTDELKESIREDILRERTQQKISTLMDEANGFVAELASKYRLGEFEKDEYVSLEDATKQIKEYADSHNLEYIETSYLTLTELRSSEDYPAGSAFVMSSGNSRGLRSVVDVLQESIPSILFNVGSAFRFDQSEFGMSQSRYIFWKSGYKQAYAPKTIDDEKSVRQQLVKAWKQQQADEAAKARAEALAKLVEKSDKPMGEALTDETVTGNPESLFLTVSETGEFTMMTSGAAPSTNPFQQQQQSPPRYSTVAGAEDAGERFFKTVFDELGIEGTGVAPNRDGSVYYVVRIKDRSPSSEDQLNEMRSNFLNQGWQAPYYYLGNGLLSQYSGDWRRELMDKYAVQFAAPADEEQPEEG
jgi:hypothetical protein